MRLFNKLLWVCAVVLFATPAAFSQDIIVLKDKASDEIQVKVLEVTKKNVKYKKWSYQDGPTFTLDVDKILAIKYQNGEMQDFAKENSSFFTKVFNKDEAKKETKKAEKLEKAQQKREAKAAKAESKKTPKAVGAASNDDVYLSIQSYAEQSVSTPTEGVEVAEVAEAETQLYTFNRTTEETAVEPTPLTLPKTAKSSFKKWEFGVFAGLTMGSWCGDGVKDDRREIEGMSSGNHDKYSFRFDMHIGARVRYNILKSLFVEADLFFNRKGFKRSTFMSSGSSWDDYGGNYDFSSDYTMITNNIELPILIGGKFSNFSVKAGAYISYAISGKLKEAYEDIYYDTIHSSEIDRGTETTSISEFSPSYNSFTFGIMAGLEYSITEHFSVSATYQRGLTSLLETSNNYFDQNIMISVGYNF